MDVLNQFNRAIDYIEDNLDGQINIEEAAKKAYSSPHHFKRMFSLVTGVTFSEYVRRRRLTLAAFALRADDVKVLDVAIRYGYDSPDAFTRAFHAMHGITPREMKTTEKPIKAYSKLSFDIKIKGVEEMNYRLVEKDAFRVVGEKETVEMKDETFDPQLWGRLEEVEERVRSYDNTPFEGPIHLSVTKEDGDVDYYIGSATTHKTPDNLAEIHIPANTWAVFHAEGPMPESLLDTWSRVYTDWFPTSTFELAKAPEMVRSTQTHTEIWIPVKQA
ncbi:GyrI-like domain-containing protein [Geomicrobium sp. JSM 1781026]|uniref:AraC family transcriptional regulator n=1 Tax=Geomicrobium sp. JSM 1781026 TaxID=3344580 RepID=UPI0035C19E15